MKQFFKIGKVSIEINSELELEKGSRLEPFRQNVPTERPDYRYRVSIRDITWVTRETCLYEMPGQKIYTDGKQIYRIFTAQTSIGDYACSVTPMPKTKVKGHMFPEREMQIWIPRRSIGQFPSENELLNVMAPEQVFFSCDALILHASLIAYHGTGILFSGPCGIGKSTQAELWRNQEEAEVINGDRALLYEKEDQIMASGLPFCGSSQISQNRQVPVRAVVLLRQGTENKVERLTGKESLSGLYRQTIINTWDTTKIEKAMDILEEIYERTEVLQYTCTAKTEAVDVLMAYLNEL